MQQDMDGSERYVNAPTKATSSQENFLSNVYGGLTACLALAAVMSLIGASWFKANFPGSLQTLNIIKWIPLGMLLIGSFVRFSGIAGWAFLIAFVAIKGFVIGPLLLWYGFGSAALAFGMTVAVFVGLTGYARWSKQSFSWLGGFLTVATVCLMVAGIAMMFFNVASNTELLFSVAGVIIFSCWILYDTSKILEVHYPTNNLSGAILDLFIDIVQLFLFILRIVGGRK